MSTAHCLVVCVCDQRFRVQRRVCYTVKATASEKVCFIQFNQMQRMHASRMDVYNIYEYIRGISIASRFSVLAGEH